MFARVLSAMPPQRRRACQCYRCRGRRGLEPLAVTPARPAVRKDKHFAGCENRHPGWCHCRNVLTEQMIMEM